MDENGTTDPRGRIEVEGLIHELTLECAVEEACPEECGKGIRSDVDFGSADQLETEGFSGPFYARSDRISCTPKCAASTVDRIARLNEKWLYGEEPWTEICYHRLEIG